MHRVYVSTITENFEVDIAPKNLNAIKIANTYIYYQFPTQLRVNIILICELILVTVLSIIVYSTIHSNQITY